MSVMLDLALGLPTMQVAELRGSLATWKPVAV